MYLILLLIVKIKVPLPLHFIQNFTLAADEMPIKVRIIIIKSFIKSGQNRNIANSSGQPMLFT